MVKIKLNNNIFRINLQFDSALTQNAGVFESIKLNDGSVNGSLFYNINNINLQDSLWMRLPVNHSSANDTMYLKIKRTSYLLNTYSTNNKLLMFLNSYLTGPELLQDCQDDNNDCENLIINGSFLTMFNPLPPYFSYSWMGGLNGDKYYVCGWNAYYNTPDICSSTQPNASYCHIPGQYLGFMRNVAPTIYFPHIGLPHSYAGMLTTPGTQWNEIIKGQLRSALEAGIDYYYEAMVGLPIAQFYGGEVAFDASSDPSPTIGTSYAGSIELSIENYVPLTAPIFPLPPNQTPTNDWGWKKIQSIAPATGSETFIYVGNLRETYNPPNGNSNPWFANLPPGNFGAQSNYYLVDNIFCRRVADAGIDQTICQNSIVTLGNTICPLLGATYSWTPTTGIADPTAAQTTANISATTTYTLTVTMTFDDGTIHTSTDDVTIYFIPPPITYTGNSIIPYNSTTILTLSGSANYQWTGSNGSSGTGNIINTGVLISDVTYTVSGNSNGCLSSTTITVTVAPPVCTSQSGTIIIDGSNNNIYSSQLTQDLLALNLATYNPTTLSYDVSNQTFFVSNNFTINSSISFHNCLFKMYDGAEIFIAANGKLISRMTTYEACNNMWKGISNEGKIDINAGWIRDAERGIWVKDYANFLISTVVFENNLFGIRLGSALSGTASVYGSIYACIFNNPQALKPPFTNMFQWRQHTVAGIQVMNLDFVDIGMDNYTVPGASIATNYFEGINCGIWIQDADVNIRNSEFTNIQRPLNLSPPNWINSNFDGSAIYAQATTGGLHSVNLEPAPIQANGSSFTINNCKYGIYSSRYNVPLLQNVKMNDVDYGVYARNNTNCQISLVDNTIENVKKVGILIQGAHNATNVSLKYNQITAFNNLYVKGIVVSGAFIGGNSGNCGLYGNLVTVGTKSSGGILIDGLNKPVIQGNTVHKNLSYIPVILLNGFTAFSTRDCKEPYFSCNHVTKGSSSGTNTGSDFRFELSPNSFIECNVSGVSPFGFDFRGPSSGTVFRTNTMGSQNTGLFISGSGVIGPQPALASVPYEGNQWVGNYSSGFGARNLNVGSLGNGQNRFLRRQADGNVFNPLVSPNYWFDATTENHVPLCGNLCDLHYTPPNDNLAFYLAIANGTISTTDYPSESLWMLKGNLYETLSENPSLLQQNDSLVLFYYSPAIEGIKDLKQVLDTLLKDKNNIEILNQSIIGNDSLLHQKAEEIKLLNSLLAADTVGDSSMSLQLTIKLAQYQLIWQTNNLLLDAVLQMQLSNNSLAYELNKAVVPGNANEAIEKLINEIYLRAYVNENGNFTPSDITTLNEISNLCPLAAGPSVYRARDLFLLFNDTLQYEDSLVCDDVGFSRETMNSFLPGLMENKYMESYINVQPNPVNDNAFFTFNSLKHISYFSIFNTTGQCVFSTTIKEGNEHFELDTEILMSGMYFVSLIDGDILLKTKFIVKK